MDSKNVQLSGIGTLVRNDNSVLLRPISNKVFIASI